MWSELIGSKQKESIVYLRVEPPNTKKKRSRSTERERKRKYVVHVHSQDKH